MQYPSLPAILFVLWGNISFDEQVCLQSQHFWESKVKSENVLITIIPDLGL
jgi:hypothetical protein